MFADVEISSCKCVPSDFLPPLLPPFLNNNKCCFFFFFCLSFFFFYCFFFVFRIFLPCISSNLLFFSPFNCFARFCIFFFFKKILVIEINLTVSRMQTIEKSRVTKIIRVEATNSFVVFNTEKKEKKIQVTTVAQSTCWIFIEWKTVCVLLCLQGCLG